MTASADIPLDGLQQDSLAAAMALIGLLRALEKSSPEWDPKAWWDGGRARLRIAATEINQDTVAMAAAKGATMAGAGMKIGKDDIHGLEPAELEGMLAGTDADVVAAMLSDGATDKGGNMKTTALCLMYGAGHQHFGKAFDAAIALKEESMAREIRNGLFTSWDRKEVNSQSKTGPRPFRLDWRERRKHALRATDPVGFNAPVTGAEPLIALGMVEFMSAPEHGGRLGTTGCGSTGRTVAWPIWEAPLPLAAVRVLLRMWEVRRIADLWDRAGGSERGRGHGVGNDAHKAKEEIPKRAESMRKYGVQVMVANIFKDKHFSTVGMGRPV